MKIAILGASVSAQTLNHATKAVTGYSEVLRRAHLDALGATELRQITYPGNRASDGALIQLEQVIAYRPQICLFEPLIEDVSRGSRATEAEIAYLYARLIEAGILPVTLFLPVPAKRVAHGGEEYQRYHRFCSAYGLPTITIDLRDLPDLETKFEGVHTLTGGAEIYAAQIVAGFAELGDPAARLTAIREGASRIQSTVMVKPCAVPVEAAGKITHLEFRLDPLGASARHVRIVQLQTIGPASPVLQATLHRAGLDGAGAETISQRLSVWDPYCHYERPSFVTLCDMTLGGNDAALLSIGVTDEEPQYSQCRRAVASWPDPAARGLFPKGAIHVISDGPVEAELLRYI